MCCRVLCAARVFGLTKAQLNGTRFRRKPKQTALRMERGEEFDWMRVEQEVNEREKKNTHENFISFIDLHLRLFLFA